MKKILYLFASIAMICLITSCAKSKKAEPFDFHGLVLVPTELQGEVLSSCPNAPKPVIMFDSAELTFNGNAGCNTMFGSYTEDGNKIQFVNVGVTRMMCDSLSNAIEMKMMNVINNTDSFSVENDVVTFFGQGEALGLFQIKPAGYCPDNDQDHVCAHEGDSTHICCHEGDSAHTCMNAKDSLHQCDGHHHEGCIGHNTPCEGKAPIKK